MARDEIIHARLRRWAEWKAGGSVGYASTNVLHPSWMPPTGMRGSVPRLAGQTDGPQTDRAIERAQLSGTLMATLSAVYLLRMSAVDASMALACQPRTITERVARIHRDLACELGVLQDAKTG